ncbi:hypothetical protein LINPERPRIM_LOCUS26893 [Linum perenne]
MREMRLGRLLRRAGGLQQDV